MTNNQDNWLTPTQAAEFAGVKIRTIYRWIELNQVETNGEKGNIRIARSSLVEIKQARNVRQTVSQVFDNTDSQKPTPGEARNNLAIQIMALQSDRDRLQTQLQQAVEDRGELRGELRAVNQRIDNLQEQLRASQVRESALTRLIIGLVTALVILAIMVALVAVIIK